MADLIIYTLRTCPTCDRARRDLAQEGVAFEERMIDEDPRWFDEASGMAVTVPILVRGEKIEVGWKGEVG